MCVVSMPREKSHCVTLHVYCNLVLRLEYYQSNDHDNTRYLCDCVATLHMVYSYCQSCKVQSTSDPIGDVAFLIQSSFPLCHLIVLVCSVRHSLDHVSSTSCGWPQLSWLYPHKKHQSFPSGGAVTPCALQVGLSQPCCCYSASLPSDSYSAHYTDHFVAGQESTCLGHNSIVLEIQANRKSLLVAYHF